MQIRTWEVVKRLILGGAEIGLTFRALAVFTEPNYYRNFHAIRTPNSKDVPEH